MFRRAVRVRRFKLKGLNSEVLNGFSLKQLVVYHVYYPCFESCRLTRHTSGFCHSCSSYGCFILGATRLSNKLLEQGYVTKRLKSSLRKFYGRYGDLIKQYEVSLSQMLNDILWPDHIQWQPPPDQTLYRTRPFTEFWVVSIEHLRRVLHADRRRLLLRTPGPVLLGLAYGLLVETNPFSNLSLFYRTMLFEYPSVLSRFYFVLHYFLKTFSHFVYFPCFVNMTFVRHYSQDTDMMS